MVCFLMFILFNVYSIYFMWMENTVCIWTFSNKDIYILYSILFTTAARALACARVVVAHPKSVVFSTTYDVQSPTSAHIIIIIIIIICYR